MVIQSDANTSTVTPRGRGDYDSAHMTPVTPAEDFRTVLLNRVSWGAVMAGVVMALAIHIILNLLGISMGAATIDPLMAESPTAAELSMGAIIWWTLAGIIAAFGGGFTAGRLAGEPKESTAGWHGITSWAMTLLVVAVLMATAAGTVLGGSFQVMANVTGGRTEIVATTGAPAATASVPEIVEGENSFGLTYQGPLGTTGETASGVTAETGADTTATATVSNEEAADAVAGAALVSAIALMLGALAAWLGGMAGAIDPTITSRRLRSDQALH